MRAHGLLPALVFAVLAACAHAGGPRELPPPTEEPLVPQHASFILYVHDQRAAAAFYRRVLAAEPVLDVPGMTLFELAHGASLGLMPEAGIARLLGGAVDPTVGRGAARAELYLLVDDPGAFHDRALAAGARELSPLQPRPWGDEAAYSQDRDGHVLAFARRLAAQ